MKIKWFSFVRIAGLFSVLTYHFFKNFYPGGFIGVDIFFTFSGFLITALMIDEFNSTNQFKVLAFYKRRFYRIVPPLVLCVLVVIPFTYLVNKDYITNLGSQIAAALGFTTNYYEIMTGGSYESKFIPHLFVHTWSLAVEVHFYIIWGLLVGIFSSIIKNLKQDIHSKRVTFRFGLAISSLLIVVFSAGNMALKSTDASDFSSIYFSSLSHCFPFFIGALLATLTGIKYVPKKFAELIKKVTPMQTTITLILGFVILIGLGFGLNFNQQFTYVGGILIASLVAGFVIVLARILNDLTPNIDEPKWATFIANTSYGMYLYHWPLFVIFSSIVNVYLAAILTIAIGLPFSALSYYIIEPMIAGKHPRDLKNVTNLKPLKSVLITGVIMLTAVSAYTVTKAPNLTNLERTLWIGSLYQDSDQMGTTKDIVLASKKKVNGMKASNIQKGVSVIGDSVTLGTRDYILANVPNSTVDAKGERTMNLAYDVLTTAQNNQVLRENVVIAIGANSLDDTNKQLQKIINDLKPGHRLILMTPYDARADASWNSSKLVTFEKTLPAKYDFITIADWQNVAAKHPDVFKGTDGVHFAGRHDGDVIYSKAINDALKEAKKTPVKQ